jgi:hypothetical protein
MVLYYLESHDLKQIESDDFTLRRQKNSQDSVIVSNPDAIPPDLKRYELKVAGDIWMKVFLALPEELGADLQAAVSGTEPMNHAIKQCFASGRTIDGIVVKRLYHLRTTSVAGQDHIHHHADEQGGWLPVVGHPLCFAMVQV